MNFLSTFADNPFDTTMEGQDFDIDPTGGSSSDDDPIKTVSLIMGVFFGDFSAASSLAIVAAFVAAIALAKAFQNPNIIAAMLFGIIFWGSYTKAITTFTTGTLLGEVAGVMVILTVGIAFVFVAAIIGIVGGTTG